MVSTTSYHTCLKLKNDKKIAHKVWTITFYTLYYNPLSSKTIIKVLFDNNNQPPFTSPSLDNWRVHTRRPIDIFLYCILWIWKSSIKRIHMTSNLQHTLFVWNGITPYLLLCSIDDIYCSTCFIYDSNCLIRCLY